MTEQPYYESKYDVRLILGTVLIVLIIGGVITGIGFMIDAGVKDYNHKQEIEKYDRSFITVVYSKEIKPSDGYNEYILNCANNTEYVCYGNVYFDIEINRTVRLFYDYNRDIESFSYNLTNPYEVES